MNTGFQFALGQNQGAWYGTGDPMDAVNTQASGVGMCNPGVITNSSGMIYNNFNFQNGLQTMGIDNVTSTFMLGSDISAPATTSFLVTGSQLIYNGETLSGGDVLFGDNTAGKANMHWNSMARHRLLPGTMTTLQNCCITLARKSLRAYIVSS